MCQGVSGKNALCHKKLVTGLWEVLAPEADKGVAVFKVIALQVARIELAADLPSTNDLN